MTALHPFLRASLLLPIALLSACGDSAEPLVPTTLAVENAAVTLLGVGSTSTIDVTVLDQNGDPLPDVQATFQSRDRSVADVDASGVVTAVDDGATEIVVTAESAETEVAITVESDLTDGVPVTGLSGDAESEVFFEIEIEPGEGDGKVLELRTTSDQGVAGLAVRFGTPPTPSSFDCIGVLNAPLQHCAIANAEAGTWHVLVIGLTDFDGGTLEASLEPLTPIEDGVPQTGLSASRFDFLYFEFQVPGADGGARPAAGSGRPPVVAGADAHDTRSLFNLWDDRSGNARSRARQASAPSLTATTSGGTGDLNLVGTSFGQVAFTFRVEITPECQSGEVGNAEACTVESPVAGPWTFGLFANQTFSGVTFEVGLNP